MAMNLIDGRVYIYPQKRKILWICIENPGEIVHKGKNEERINWGKSSE